jgi:hypothetical protein
MKLSVTASQHTACVRIDYLNNAGHILYCRTSPLGTTGVKCRECPVLNYC